MHESTISLARSVSSYHHGPKTQFFDSPPSFRYWFIVVSFCYMVSWTAIGSLIPYFSSKYGKFYYVYLNIAFYGIGLPIVYFQKKIDTYYDAVYGSKIMFRLRVYFCLIIISVCLIISPFVNSVAFIFLVAIIGACTWSCHGVATSLASVVKNNSSVMQQIGFALPGVYGLIMTFALVGKKELPFNILLEFYLITMGLVIIGVIAWYILSHTNIVRTNLEKRDKDLGQRFVEHSLQSTLYQLSERSQQHPSTLLSSLSPSPSSSSLSLDSENPIHSSSSSPSSSSPSSSSSSSSSSTLSHSLDSSSINSSINSSQLNNQLFTNLLKQQSSSSSSNPSSSPPSSPFSPSRSQAPLPFSQTRQSSLDSTSSSSSSSSFHLRPSHSQPQSQSHSIRESFMYIQTSLQKQMRLLLLFQNEEDSALEQARLFLTESPDHIEDLMSSLSSSGSDLRKKLSPHRWAIFLTIFASILQGSFVSLTSNHTVNHIDLSTILYFVRIFSDLLGRPLALLGPPLIFQSIERVLIGTSIRLFSTFYFFLCVSNLKGLEEVGLSPSTQSGAIALIAFQAIFSFLSGYFNCLTYEFAFSSFESEVDRSFASQLLTLSFQTSCATAVLITVIVVLLAVFVF